MNRFFISLSVLFPFISLCVRIEDLVGNRDKIIFAPAAAATRLYNKHVRKPSDEMKPPLLIDGISAIKSPTR